MIVVLMGVSGSGKTAVGKIVGMRLGWDYLDADDFHPAANVEKMRAGIPLQDADRWPWLERLNALLREFDARGASVILGCSALKAVYRVRLAKGCNELRWVHLSGSFELIESRLRARSGHYMPSSLLRSQFAILEAPQDALTVPIEGTPDEIAQASVEQLDLRPAQ
jgi:gluconokinase